MEVYQAINIALNKRALAMEVYDTINIAFNKWTGFSNGNLPVHLTTEPDNGSPPYYQYCI